MFYTHPAAELKLPPGLAPLGEQSWHWVELSLQVPYFFLSFTEQTEDGPFRRHLIFSEVGEAMRLRTYAENEMTSLEIGLLSPGYINGSGSYQMGRIKEIWERPDGSAQMYVMSDGTKLHYRFHEDAIKDQEMELLISL